MIAPSVVQEIKRLLAEGRSSQRKIARMMGVSRGTVGAIARGKRRDYGPRPGDGDADVEAPSGPPQRCPGCGGMVYMPCGLCHVRKLIAKRRAARRVARAAEPLRLDLSECHRARYEEVRRRPAREGPRGARPRSGLQIESQPS